MSEHSVYLRDWREFRALTEGRCEARCSQWHNGRHGKQCRFAGAWYGPAGLVLCRVHERKWEQATAFIPNIRWSA